MGDYTYGNNAGPHAVTQAGDVSYEYDANGNNISSSDGRSLTYSTFDKVTEVTTDNHKVSFAYGPNRNRYKRVDEDIITGQIKTIYYVGSVEIVVHESGANSGRMEYRRQLGNALETLVYAATNTPTPEQFTRYLLQDHLGSVDVIVNKLGEIEQELSFDAWGKRRNATDWQAQLESSYSPLDVFGGLNSITSRGYTGHEMVDSVGIIHMNGRIYDPTLGRFLQADPFIQAPYNTQSLNRYSYVLNNPLNATDPSGYFFSLIASFIAVQAFYYVLPESWHSTFNAIVTLAATAICGPACGAQAAAYTSFHSTYSQTGSFGASFRAGAKAYVISTISAEVFGRIGDSFQGDAANSLGHVGAHGFAGGVLAELQGGKFGHGFISAGVSKALTPVIEGWDSGYYGGGKDLGQAAAAAVVGGTTSVITGGKFANGAITAAYANLYNAQRGAQEKLSARERHYARNAENDAFLKEKGLYNRNDLTTDQLEDLEFKRVGAPEDKYHTWGPGNENNQKWVYDNGTRYGSYEIIIRPTDTGFMHVMDANVMGTLNYGGNPWSHFWRDVVPYYRYGNSPSDTTTGWQRFRRTFE